MNIGSGFRRPAVFPLRAPGSGKVLRLGGQFSGSFSVDVGKKLQAFRVPQRFFPSLMNRTYGSRRKQSNVLESFRISSSEIENLRTPDAGPGQTGRPAKRFICRLPDFICCVLRFTDIIPGLYMQVAPYAGYAFPGVRLSARRTALPENLRFLGSNLGFLGLNLGFLGLNFRFLGLNLGFFVLNLRFLYR